jgi:hypothetical protein
MIVVGNISPVIEHFIRTQCLSVSGNTSNMEGIHEPLALRVADLTDQHLLFALCVDSEVDRFCAVETMVTPEYSRCWGGVACGSMVEAERFLTDQMNWLDLVEPVVAGYLPYEFNITYDTLAKEPEMDWLKVTIPCSPERIEPCLFSFIHDGRKYDSFSDPPALSTMIVRDSLRTAPSEDGRTWVAVDNEILELTSLSENLPVYATAPGHVSGQVYVSQVYMKIGLSQLGMMDPERTTVGLFHAQGDSRLKRRTTGTVPRMLMYASNTRPPELLLHAAADDNPQGRDGVYQVLNGGALRAHKSDSSAILGQPGRFALRSRSGASSQ